MITQQTPQVHNQHPTLYTFVHTQHLHLVHTQHPTWYTSNTHTWYTWCPYSTIPPGTKSTSPLHLVPTFNISILFHTTKLSTRSCLSLSPTPFLLRKRKKNTYGGGEGGGRLVSLPSLLCPINLSQKWKKKHIQWVEGGGGVSLSSLLPLPYRLITKSLHSTRGRGAKVNPLKRYKN